jgi:peptidoglycan/xylan/chitin deacetylase (PgdA/CDA1 family)
MTRAPAPLEITGYAFLSMLGLYMLCVGGTNSWDVDERQKSLVGPAEISAMQAGVIKFGSHTCTHGSLSDMQPTEILLGLTHSCATHMGLVRRPVVTLAYPHNKQNSTVRVRAWQAGYQAAALCHGRSNARWTNPLALMRIAVDSSTTVETLGQQQIKSRWLAGI